MAISSKIEEIILELTKNVGNIYDSLLYGIGDETTPGSSIFEINNLISMAETGYPYFGIIETQQPTSLYVGRRAPQMMHQNASVRPCRRV